MDVLSREHMPQLAVQWVRVELIGFELKKLNFKRKLILKIGF